ncbi:MAG: hypothetical protein D6679_00010 [Candidatus Hydrogenedentota bacterium]|nr:MAG: hypothetical protein D6679_00010 [Candidatus Hydrogenedentota bacterium]
MESFLIFVGPSLLYFGFLVLVGYLSRKLETRGIGMYCLLIFVVLFVFGRALVLRYFLADGLSRHLSGEEMAGIYIVLEAPWWWAGVWLIPFAALAKDFLPRMSQPNAAAVFVAFVDSIVFAISILIFRYRRFRSVRGK